MTCEQHDRHLRDEIDFILQHGNPHAMHVLRSTITTLFVYTTITTYTPRPAKGLKLVKKAGPSGIGA